MGLHEEELYLKELIEEQARYNLLTDIAAGVLVMLIGFFVVNILVDKYKKKTTISSRLSNL